MPAELLFGGTTAVRRCHSLSIKPRYFCKKWCLLMLRFMCENEFSLACKSLKGLKLPIRPSFMNVRILSNTPLNDNIIVLLRAIFLRVTLRLKPHRRTNEWIVQLP